MSHDNNETVPRARELGGKQACEVATPWAFVALFALRELIAEADNTPTNDTGGVMLARQAVELAERGGY